MNKMRKCFALILVFCLTFCSMVTMGGQSSDAASKKTVYVMTKMVFHDYDPDDDEGFDMSKATFSWTYDKNGLLKSWKMVTDNGNIKVKSSVKYGKSSHLKSNRLSMYYKGQDLCQHFSRKFTVNKKGYVTKIKTYNEKGKLSGYTKYFWNKKYKKTKEMIYSSKGKLKEKIKYSYYSNGKMKEAKTYSASDKLESRLKYEYNGSKVTITEYDDDGEVEAKTIAKMKNGNIVSMKEYDENGELEYSTKFTYKKVKTSKKRIVQGQQEVITEVGL